MLSGNDVRCPGFPDMTTINTPPGWGSTTAPGAAGHASPSQSCHPARGVGRWEETNSLPGENRCGDSPASRLCFLAGVWIVQLHVSPVRAAEHLPGRYIPLTGWDSHLGAGDRPAVSFLLPFPSLSQRPGPTSCDRKILPGAPAKLPDVSGRAPHPAPPELGGLGLGEPLAHGPFIVLPSLRTSTP